MLGIDRSRMAVAAVAFLATTAVGLAAWQPEPWNLDARQKFAEQRFGIFIHWGISALYSREIGWFLLKAKDEEAYARAKDCFYPSKFDAAEWARTIKASGARYVTFTSRHHDGFSMWPTKVDDGYNVMNTPFKRDIVGELAKACTDEGLQFNIYYSLADWHRKDYPVGKHEESIVRERRPDYPSYRRFMLAQLGELLENYHPGLIWFDGEWDVKQDAQGKPFDWQLDELYDLIHAHRALVINNDHRVTRDKEDIQTFERDLPGENTMGFSTGQTVVRDRPLEQSDIIQRGSWAYDISMHEFRPPEEVVTMIVRAAAKDSNLAMNVGPDASGRFPPRGTEILAGVGTWMAANGEAIYGTRGGGIVKNADGSETAKTRKGDVIYEFTIRKDKFPEMRKVDAGLAGSAGTNPTK